MNTPTTAPIKAPRFQFYTLADVEKFPDPVYLIEGILPTTGLVIFYAAPGVGKTFVALDMALSIAFDQNWLNLKVKKGAVVYVAAEGLYGFKQRAAAFRKEHNHPANGNIHLLGGNLNLFEKADVQALINALKERGIEPALIVIDTFARCFIGGDENSSRDVGQAVTNIDLLKEATKATIMLVHHTKKLGDSERGSSALRGAADVMMTLTGDAKEIGDPVFLTCEKMKDDEPFPNTLFVFKKVVLPNNKTSLVLEKWDGPLPTEESISEEQIGKCIDALNSLGKLGGTFTKWLDAYSKATGKSKGTFTRILPVLKERGLVTSDKEGKGAKYTVVADQSSVSVSPPSQNSLIKTESDGLTSPPSLGGDTETNTETQTKTVLNPSKNGGGNA